MNQENITSQDNKELDKFTAMAADWWNPKGKFEPLHKMNPLRLKFIRDQIAQHFNCSIQQDRPFANLRLLDIGCGGGLVCEPMARLGADVTGVDLVEQSIHIARTHAKQSGLSIAYKSQSIESLALAKEQFDIVLALEVVEHVADLACFLQACGQVLKPHGLMIVSTLNRTLKSFALGIVAAEYLLNWLPRGTHDWNRFVKPQELTATLESQGLDVVEIMGAVYNPASDLWSLSKDVGVNYFAVAKNWTACPPSQPHQSLI